ncbi:hypothetical protein ABR737_41420 [Streptomyces sp. Edi2]|uniref:hypothetical protein n=1 Tax=Streptomyces sp. Edi2 TaxID=3162528 RepID=UPI0033060321
MTVHWVASFDSPDAGIDTELLALAEPGFYAIASGTTTARLPHRALQDCPQTVIVRSIPVPSRGPGFLMLNYGPGTPTVTLVAHLAYGTLVGGFLTWPG